MLFSVVPQLDSIDLHSLCGPVISETVWCSLACSEFCGGFSTYYLNTEKVLTAESGLFYIQGTESVVHNGPPG